MIIIMEFFTTTGVHVLLPFIVAFAVAALLGPSFINWLHKLKYGQEIREEGPAWHQKKSDTPTMGGIIFMAGIIAAAAATSIVAMLGANMEAFDIWSYIGLTAAALAFGAIGFIDDYIKVVKKRNLGLTPIQKFMAQLIVAVLYVVIMYAKGSLSPMVEIPFIHYNLILPIWLYVPFILFVIVGVVNAVNLTDGLDGLASSVTVVVAMFFLATAITGTVVMYDVSAFAASVIGGLIAFLIYNKYPAKVFMGDTGSLFLGAAVVFMAINTGKVIYLIPVGFVYFMETLSVIIQTSYFKYTKKKYGEGRRVFKMTPIHHHFEMCGWKETKIVRVFTLVTLLLCVIAYII